MENSIWQTLPLKSGGAGSCLWILMYVFMLYIFLLFCSVVLNLHRMKSDSGPLTLPGEYLQCEILGDLDVVF